MTTVTVPAEETWRLDDLYPDEAAFRREKAQVADEIPNLAAFRGSLLSNASRLADALDGVARISERLRRLHTFASLSSDRDIRQAEARSVQQEIELVATSFSSALAFMRPELLSGEDAQLLAFMDEEPRLQPHRPYLLELMRQRRHVLGAAEERILAEASLVTRDPHSLFVVLNNAELPRPQMEDDDGKSVRLDPVQFARLRASPNRERRRQAFDLYFGAYADFRETFAQNLSTSIKADMFRARSRHYDSCLEAAMDPDAVPTSVYENLIAQVRRHLPLLHRYFELRRRALGLGDLHYADLYTSISERPPRRYEVGEARQLLLESLRPMGEDYVQELARGFEERWVDWHPTPGKRSGAYSNGWAYGVHPFVLMNYIGDHESVSTLAHEMGHAMHSHLSNRTQPFPCADYTIFVAEVASTLNETLLASALLERTTDPDERRFLIANELDSIRGTLFRQTMFAEFELDVHRTMERGETLNGVRLSGAYLALQRAYHGHDVGTVEVPEAYGAEWAAVPHFHYNFYVYQYATGIVAAIALAHQLAAEGEPAQRRVLEFLSAGGSRPPLVVLRAAGVDLEDESPYLDAFAHFERRLDELDELLPA